MILAQISLTLFFLTGSFASNGADYQVEPGTLHRKGKVMVHVLPGSERYRVKMDFDVKKKEFVPVPGKLLRGSTIMEFPNEFRTEKGYKNLEKKKNISIHKANLRFLKRANVGNLKAAYFFEVLPTNKKSRIKIIYHPKLPSVGWLKVDITFLSEIPVLNGYELEAKLKE